MLKPQVLVCVATMLIGVVLASVLQAAQKKGRPRASVPKRFEAQEFVLKDAEGRELAKLHAPGGTPVFALNDRDGTPKVRLAVTEEGTATIFIGALRPEAAKEAKGGAAVIAVLPDGSVALSLQAQSKGSVSIAVVNDKTPSMTIVDGTGKETLQSVAR